eukprot:gene51831-63379_t
MVSLGLSMAAGMRVSAAVGAGETPRLRPIGYSALALGVVISVFFMIIYFATGRMVAGWFVDDAAVVDLAARLLVVAALFQVADGAQVIGAALLRGLTDVKLPAVITFVAYWLVAIPGGYVFGVHGKFGAVGIWMALAAGLGVAAVFLAWRFARLTRTVTARRGRARVSARNSQSSSLARPSMAGAWTLTFNASPSQPTTALRSGRSRFQLQTLPESDYPDIATGEFSHSFTLAASALSETLAATEFAISTEETRYYLNG